MHYCSLKKTCSVVRLHNGLRMHILWTTLLSFLPSSTWRKQENDIKWKINFQIVFNFTCTFLSQMLTHRQSDVERYASNQCRAGFLHRSIFRTEICWRLTLINSKLTIWSRSLHTFPLCKSLLLLYHSNHLWRYC